MKQLPDFNDSLSGLMLERGLTIEMLSKAIGVSVATICYWRLGKHALSLHNALKLCDFFDCSLEFLIGRSDTRLAYTPQICPPFFDRLKNVMALYNKTEYRMVKDLQLSRSVFFRWKTGGNPLIDTLIKITKYFDCTLDFLVGRDR